jgi:2-polyprenyl-3-methyl-5-hydroxy-6-metoxy-1,4-benzoquinol methylase
MLDVQARSGKGSEFWFLQGKIASTTCVDFSEYLRGLAIERLQGKGLVFESIQISDIPLPFNDAEFDLVGCYETVEHIYDYRSFIRELTRVMKPDGLMIVTCPNVAWEWVHWLSAVININHSEGPHRFIRRKKLLDAFRDAGLEVLDENSTIMLPFNRQLSIRADRWMEARFPEWIKRHIALRRTFIMKKRSYARNL